MSNFIITVDIDWACEQAIEETLNFLDNHGCKPTIFSTHNSPTVESAIDQFDIGLHPYFSADSSHGTTINDVVHHIIQLTHNFKAFRCHRFGICNLSKQALINAGMILSSNVCTDLELIKPFKDRSGIIEAPIFLEDGGYLERQHSLHIDQALESKLAEPTPKVILIHPMHFAINTPHFNYMSAIKNQLSREQWRLLGPKELEKLRFSGRGIRHFLTDIILRRPTFMTLRSLYHNAVTHNSAGSL